jgi:hypothetical protein
VLELAQHLDDEALAARLRQALAQRASAFALDTEEQKTIYAVLAEPSPAAPAPGRSFAAGFANASSRRRGRS